MSHRVSVYRDAEGYDATNGGVSSKFSVLHVLDEDEPWPDDAFARDGSPVFRLERTTGTWPVVKPHPKLRRGGENSWLMFGGNLAFSSDSRWSAAIEKIIGVPVRAISIHDREE